VADVPAAAVADAGAAVVVAAVVVVVAARATGADLPLLDGRVGVCEGRGTLPRMPGLP
jgi:hypothetical protein